MELLFSAQNVPGMDLSGTPSRYSVNWMEIRECNVPGKFDEVRWFETAAVCSSSVLLYFHNDNREI